MCIDACILGICIGLSVWIVFGKILSEASSKGSVMPNQRLAEPVQRRYLQATEPTNCRTGCCSYLHTSSLEHSSVFNFKCRCRSCRQWREASLTRDSPRLSVVRIALRELFVKLDKLFIQTDFSIISVIKIVVYQIVFRCLLKFTLWLDSLNYSICDFY